MTGKPNAAKVLVLRCEECGHRIAKRMGYVKIDRAAIVCQSVNGWNIVDATGEKIFWKVLHSQCDKDQKRSDFMMDVGRFSTTGDLLEATAWLLRNQPELIVGSNWHGLISRVLCDTREYVDLLKQAKILDSNERRKRRYARNGSNVITAVLDRDEK